MPAIDRGHAGGGPDEPCRCEPALADTRLVIGAAGCGGAGDLARAPGCRATIVRALAGRDVGAVVVRAPGTEHRYEGAGVALLVAAGRFVDSAAGIAPALAIRARSDPIGSAHVAAGRGGAVARIAAETGLVEGAVLLRTYAEAFPSR